MREWISLEDGLEILTEQVVQLPKETVSLTAARGRVLAEDIQAAFGIPPFNRSPLDGFAVRSCDVTEARQDMPIMLDVIEEIKAGRYSETEVGQNQAVKIFTGAPIPGGADEVIRWEDVVEADNKIYVFRPTRPFTNYCHAGEDVAWGETILTAGTVLKSGEISILAGLGMTRAPVFRIPRISVLSTGDELMSSNAPLEFGKIYNSNYYGLIALIQGIGCEPMNGGLAQDNAVTIAGAIETGLSEADVLITTGGVSTGDYDLVQEALRILDAELLFWRLDMRPGTPVLCSKKGGKLIISLSGNPTAAMVVFHLLAVPVIRKLMGQSSWQSTRTTAELQDEFNKTRRQRRFLLCKRYLENGQVKVKLTGRQNSGGVQALLGCDALIDIVPNSGPLRSGDSVEIILIDP